jgi:hypothetical protein
MVSPGHPRLASLALIGVLTAGCGGSSVVENTLRVVVSTDLDVPTTIDNLVIRGSRGSNIVFTNEYDEPYLQNLPDSLLLHNGQMFDDQGHEITIPVRIVVDGRLGDTSVVSRSAELSFVTDRPRVLHMPLCASCVTEDCGSGETCRGGECLPEGVTIEGLPVDDGSQPAEGPECPAGGG